VTPRLITGICRNMQLPSEDTEIICVKETTTSE
jgi:hypothetical protein